MPAERMPDLAGRHLRRRLGGTETVSRPAGVPALDFVTVTGLPVDACGGPGFRAWPFARPSWSFFFCGIASTRRASSRTDTATREARGDER